MLFLVLVALMVIMAMAKTASGGGGDGGGAGGDHDHDHEQFLKLWNGRGGADAKEDYLNWDDDDDDDEQEEEEEEEAEQVMAWAAKCRPPAGRNVVNVDSFGAAGDGCSDDTEVCARIRTATIFSFLHCASHCSSIHAD